MWFSDALWESVAHCHQVISKQETENYQVFQICISLYSFTIFCLTFAWFLQDCSLCSLPPLFFTKKMYKLVFSDLKYMKWVVNKKP